MAVVPAIFTDPDKSSISSNVQKVNWTLGNNDQTSLFEAPHLPDKTVTLGGTFASATVVVRDKNGATIDDVNGTALSFTAKGSKVVGPNVSGMDVSATGGGGTTSITVEIVAVGAGR